MAASREFNWVNIAFLTLSPLVAFLGAGFSLYYQDLHPEDLVFFCLMAACSGLALTAGYHRYYSHRSYECHPLVQAFFLLFGAAALQNSALIWACNHRSHHRFVDQEGDPHNSTQGTFWAHMGWTFYKANPNRSFANVSDLQTDRLVLWQHRHYLPLGIAIGFGLPFLIGLVCGRLWEGFLWGGLVRTVLLHHATFLINSAGHRSGPQPYSDKDSSRDNWWLAVLMFGDGYHNFHHAFPGDYRSGIAWYHWDPTKWWIWSLHRLGLAWRLQRAPAGSILQARMRMERCKAKALPDAQPEEGESMSSQNVNTPDGYIQTSLSFLHELLGTYHPRDFAVRLWDGTTWDAEPGQPTRFILVLQHPGALRTMFWPPNELTLGEAYMYNDFDIEGEIEAIFALADYLLALPWSATDQLRYGEYLLSLPPDGRPHAGRPAAQLDGELHSQARDRQAVTYHYNVSNDFYTPWLGRRMVYTCAYFATPDDDLDTAQERKLDYLCRKLRLRPGQRLLDIGCGWGGLVIYAAYHYGVEALGITLSQPQAELANERIRQAGLADRCRVEVCDYREVNEPNGYDKLVSVGMFEHVGESLLPEYFQQAWRLLRPGGVFLNHGIARHIHQPAQRRPSFINRYVFPDIETVPISTTLRVAETTGFEVRDVESLREHYVLTLRHWVRNLEAHHDEVLRTANEETYRAWRLCFSGAAHEFQTGRRNLYQALLVKPDQGRSGLPLTRQDWYEK